MKITTNDLKITTNDLLNNGFTVASDKYNEIYYYYGPEDKVKLDGKGSLYLTHYESLFGPWRKFDDPNLNIHSVEDLKDIIYNYYSDRKKYIENEIKKLQELYDKYSELTI